ncbi:MAG: molybdate ABC transporter substrate-binding protein [Methylobacillus sp.]|jgi:molybdate transport system substrate-binding protein|nr:molybdate ABC transporter substrate-binding protein [Methylobacillus sp.]
MKLKFSGAKGRGLTRRFFESALLISALLLAPIFAHAETLTVAVAANMKFAFGDLAAAFTKESGIAIRPIYGASGKIVAQVREGAPYDVFLAADTEFPAKLVESGQAVAQPKIYAHGKLVLWMRDDKSAPDLLAALRDARIKKIAIADPKLAPYGVESLKALDKLGLKTALAPKLVYAEDVAQVVQFVDSGNADAGLTAKSLVAAPENAGRGKWMDVPATVYTPIAQSAVILKHGQSEHGAAARKFYDFLYSAKARAILEKFGYGVP